MKKQEIDLLKQKARDFFINDAKHVYTPTEIGQIMAELKRTQELPKKTTITQMVQVLKTLNKFKLVELSFPGKNYKRYTWGKETIYEVLLSIDSDAYYSHLSALHFHKLLDKNISDIYLNIEQAAKHRYHSKMEQEDINKAFLRHPRITNNTVLYQQRKIYLLNGMNTGNLGVITMRGSKKENIIVTNMERTLIDIAVRPYYSGGVQNVLNTYKKLIGKVSVVNIVKMIKTLDYSYPYHQAIGFYLEKVGFKEISKIMRKEFRMEYDFYLTYQMEKPEYCKEWRIFYPNDLFS